MLDKKNLEEIKKETERFFEKIGFVKGEIKIDIEQTKEDVVSLNLRTPTPQVLIGKDGQTLRDIQHLLRRILRKDLKQGFLELDINDYKKKKIEYLKGLARSLADEVALTKKEKILSPMPSYERRIIHLELSGRDDVRTESIGEEPERKIMIKPSTQKD